MREKEQRYVETAIAVITRYGVRRTTMADIAREAGISRQTLYASFANKDEIVAASIRRLGEIVLERLQQTWREGGSLDEHVEAFFRYAVIEMYDQLQAMPDSDDLVNGYSDAARAATEEGSDRLRAVLAERLREHDTAFRQQDVSTEAVADLLLSSAHAFKYKARDRTHLLSLLRTLKIVVLHLAGQHSCGKV